MWYRAARGQEVARSVTPHARKMAGGAKPDTTRARKLLRYWPTAAALLVAITVRSLSWLNCDVSWLLTLGEQVLAGAKQSEIARVLRVHRHTVKKWVKSL